MAAAMTTTPAPATDLAGLAERINGEHAAAAEHLRTALDHARRAGELLLAARGQLPHGAWLPWLEQHVAFSERTAQGYMRVARRWPELEAARKAQPVADLGIREALALLAAPREAEAEAQASDDADEAWALHQRIRQGTPDGRLTALWRYLLTQTVARWDAYAKDGLVLGQTREDMAAQLAADAELGPPPDPGAGGGVWVSWPEAMAATLPEDAPARYKWAVAENLRIHRRIAETPVQQAQLLAEVAERDASRLGSVAAGAGVSGRLLVAALIEQADEPAARTALQRLNPWLGLLMAEAAE